MPSAAGAEDAAAYLERLVRLRVWAGRPSLRRLASLSRSAAAPGGHMVDQLPRSTLSEVLNGKRLPQLPRMEFVEAFVAACLRARNVRQDVIDTVVERWLAEWWRLETSARPGPSPDGTPVETNGVPAGTGDGRENAGRPLVGRSEALRGFAEVVDTLAVTRTCQCLAIVGDPGVGKTRLLDELAAMTARRQALVLRGRVGEFEQELPLAAMVDALDGHLEGREEWVRDRLGAASLRLLATLFPSLSDAIEDDALIDVDLGASVRYRVYRAVRRLLEELARPSGLALLLDDVHWSDNDSAELFAHLLRRPPRGPVLIAIAYRPAQVSPALARLVGAQLGPDRMVTVRPFTPAETREFLGSEVGGADVRRLHEASGGVPLYLEALARMGVTEPAHGATAPEPPGIPPAATTALERELDGVSPEASLVARAAAIVADEFDVPLVAVASELDERTVVTALDEMAARDIVRPAGAGDRFRFRHPLVRSVVHHRAAPAWRLSAHARIAAHLERVGAPVTVRAHHVVRSGRHGDETAVATLTEASEVIAANAPASAAHLLSRALELMGTRDDADRRPDLLLRLAELQLSAGRLTEAGDTAREALESLPDDDHVRRTRALFVLTMIERLLGRPQESRRLLLGGLRHGTDRQVDANVRLRLRLAADDLYRGDPKAAEAVLRTLPADAPSWDTALRLEVAAIRPMAAFAARRLDDAARHIAAADRVLADACDGRPPEHLPLKSLSWLVWTELFLGRFDGALRHLDQTLTLTRATGQTLAHTVMLTATARAYAMLGRLREGAAVAEEAARQADAAGSRQLRVIALAQQCLVAASAGDGPAALRHADQAVADAEDGAEWWALQAHFARATALIHAGLLEPGIEAVARLHGGDALTLDQASLLSCCELAAHAEAERGRWTAARRWAERAARYAHRELRTNTGLVHLARAHALHGTAPVASALHARTAAEIFTGTGQRVEAGRARLRAAAGHLDAGERARARDELANAAEIFASCGALGLHTEALRRLAPLDRAPTLTEPQP
ncbi:tetratricopeptide repeat protein [Actinomadura pelletieri DSM 43383]|uniref:Tetratricopeptide repeat protein n=2 Tax=Actinomadura pelletieri TaxID=111805 RepID=A0A495QJ62_9ACTN|nr:tetratricopeptide repeat protein [Actinomadura pelletieri DSM 43383]